MELIIKLLKITEIKNQWLFHMDWAHQADEAFKKWRTKFKKYLRNKRTSSASFTDQTQTILTKFLYKITRDHDGSLVKIVWLNLWQYSVSQFTLAVEKFWIGWFTAFFSGKFPRGSIYSLYSSLFSGVTTDGFLGLEFHEFYSMLYH